MNREEILSHVDHTLLKPEATWPQIQTLCDEAIANHTASVCINTCYVKQAVEYMAGRIPVCCVVGFPLGAMDKSVFSCFLRDILSSLRQIVKKSITLFRHLNEID